MQNKYKLMECRSNIIVTAGLCAVVVASTCFSQANAADNETQTRQKKIVVGDLIGAQGLKATKQDLDNAALQLRNCLADGLVQSRKFVVLDRDFSSISSKEKRNTDLDRNEAGRTAHLGKEATADYILTGEITKLQNQVTLKNVDTSGRRIEIKDYAVQVGLKIIDVSTSQVLYSKTYDNPQNGTDMNQQSGFDDWLSSSAKQIANEASLDVLELVYPLKVANVTTDGEIMLNEGSSRLHEGDRCDIFLAGKVAQDPDTGLEIGREETILARIQITRVLPKASYGILLEPISTPIPAGAICRLAKKPNNMKPADKEPKKIKKNPLNDLY